MTHICVVKQTSIDSDNGLSPGRRQAVIWTSAKWRPFCLGLNVLTATPVHSPNVINWTALTESKLSTVGGCAVRLWKSLSHGPWHATDNTGTYLPVAYQIATGKASHGVTGRNEPLIFSGNSTACWGTGSEVGTNHGASCDNTIHLYLPHICIMRRETNCQHSASVLNYISLYNKILRFVSKFHRNMFFRCNLAISHHWFRKCLWQKKHLSVSSLYTEIHPTQLKSLARSWIAPSWASILQGLILGLHPANERRHYKVTPSLTGWARTSNQPWNQSTRDKVPGRGIESGPHHQPGEDNLSPFDSKLRPTINICNEWSK